MAVFQGARLRTGSLPSAHVSIAPGRPVPAAGPRQARRARPMGLLMAGIMTATMLGLVYLTQTLGANASDSEVRALAVESAELQDRLRRQAVWVETFADADEIAKRAKPLGLRKLGAVVVLPAP